MTCCLTEQREGGYATAAAITFSMALALIASALSGLAVAHLRASRADLQRLQTDRRLVGAIQLASEQVLTTSKSVRLAWDQGVGPDHVVLTAEPEAAKLNYDAASRLDDKSLALLGDNPTRLRTRLVEAASGVEPPIWPGGLDSSARWRACAPILISRFGQAKDLNYAPASAPDGRAFSWRMGEVWRIHASAREWEMVEFVRFTGVAGRPVAIVARRLSRDKGGDQSCSAQLGA